LDSKLYRSVTTSVYSCERDTERDPYLVVGVKVFLSLLLSFVTSALDVADCSTSRPGRFTRYPLYSRPTLSGMFLLMVSGAAVHQVTPVIGRVIIQTPRMIKFFPFTVHVVFVVDGYAQTSVLPCELLFHPLRYCLHGNDSAGSLKEESDLDEELR